MAGLNMAKLSTRLQTMYIPGVEEILASSYLLEDNLKKAKDVQVQGSEFVFLTHTGRNEGHGFRAEGEDLPEAGYQRFNQAKIPVYFFYHRGSITGQGLAVAKGPQTYVKEIQSELKRIMTDALREFNLYNYGDQSGVRATVDSISGNEITCRWSHVYGENGVNMLRRNMKVSIRDAARTTLRLARNMQIVSVNHTTRTFIVAAGSDLSDTVAGDEIFIAGNWDPLNGSKQCLGLQNAIDAGSKNAVYLNLARAGNNIIHEWQSSVFGDETAPQPLTLAQLQNMDSAIADNAPDTGALSQNIYLTTSGVRDAYFLDLIAATDRRFMANDRPLKYDAGFAGLDYNGKAWYVDRDCPRGFLFNVNISKFRKAVLDDWDFLKDLQPNGGILILNSNKDQYTFTMRRYFSGAYTVAPRQHGLRKGIQDSGSSVIN